MAATAIADCSQGVKGAEQTLEGKGAAQGLLHGQLSKARNLDAFEEVLQRRKEELDSEAVVAGAVRLLQLHEAGLPAKQMESAITLLASRVTTSPETISPLALATFANISVKIGSFLPKVLSAVAKQLKKRKAEFSVQDLANFIWAIAKSNQQEPDPFGRHTVGKRHRTLFKQALKDIQVEVCKRPGDFESHQIAAIMWAYASLQQPASLVFTHFGRRVAKAAREFSASNLSTVAMAYAKLRHAGSASVAFKAVEREVLRRPEEFSEKDLSNIAWACGVRQCTSPELNEVFCTRLIASPHTFTPAALANITNAAATAKRCPTELYDIMEKEILRHGHKFHPKALATMAKAFAVGHMDYPKALDALGKHIVAKIEHFQPFHVVCSVAWSFAILNRDPHGLLDAVWFVSAERAASGVRMRPGDMATIIRSLAITGHLSKDKMAVLQPRIARIAHDNKEMATPDLCAFFQAELLLNPGLDPTTCVLPRALFTQAGRAWRKVTSQGSHPSASQKAIHRLLEELGLPFQLEHRTSDNMLTIDTAITSSRGGPGVAVEVDGPRHFTSNRPHRELGSTVLRRRTLEAHGWTVVNLPVHEWAPMAEDRDRQLAWLRRKFEEAGVEL